MYVTFVPFDITDGFPFSRFFGLYGAEYRCFQITQNGCWGVKGMVLWFGAQFGRSQNINVLELPFIKRPNVKQSTMAKDANVPNLPRCEHMQLLRAAWRVYGA